MVPRQARAEVTRQSIVVAGVELFGDIGYGDTDMIDVIERAGTTKGTCYYYFPTKGSLAEAIIEQGNLRIAGAMGDIWESDAPSMHKLISATFRFIGVTENDPIARVGYQLRQADRQVSTAGATGFGDTEVIFASAIRRAVADGHVRRGINDREVAGTVFAALTGCRLLADVFSHDPFDRLSQAWRTMLRGIAPEDAVPALSRYVRSVARSYQQ